MALALAFKASSPAELYHASTTHSTLKASTAALYAQVSLQKRAANFSLPVAEKPKQFELVQHGVPCHLGHAVPVL